jgi:ubiquinone/menaquinone biosynthesis C-methylase UbiE
MRMIQMNAEIAGGSDAVRASSSIGFKIRDASSYDSVAEKFDLFTERLSQPLATRMIALAQLAPKQRVLDVGTGTGLVALNAARFVGTDGVVIGIDLSDGMLAKAAEKAANFGLKNCSFQKMDAEALDIEDQSIDAVLSLFALLHLPDPLAALREMFRTLRPGGRLVLAVGSGAPLWSWNGLAHRVSRLPDLVRKIQGRQLTAPGFLNNLVEERLPKNGSAETLIVHHSGIPTGGVNALVRKAGFKVLANHWEGHETILDTPEEFWEIQRTFSSIARKRIADAAPEKVSLLHEDFLRKCRDVQARGGRLVYPFAAFFVVARRDQEPSKF